MLLQILHSPLKSLLWNYLGHFVLAILLFWNGCIIASFYPLDALLFHFYLLDSRLQYLSCRWRWINLLLLTDIPFSWATAQFFGPFGRDSSSDEFMIGAFIKWHLLFANWRLWLNSLRLPIGHQFRRRRIHSEVLLLWKLLRANCRWCSDAVMPIVYQ